MSTIYLVGVPRRVCYYNVFQNIHDFCLELFKDNLRLISPKNLGTNIIPDNSNVICFTDILHTMKINNGKHVQKWNVIFINVESMFVKDWYGLFLLFYNKINRVITIFDYTYKNALKFKQISDNINWTILAPTYLPELEENRWSSDKRDIDILFFGSLNDRRNKIKRRLDRLLKFTKRTIFLNNKFDITADSCRRCRIALVINYYPNNCPIDYYRIQQYIMRGIFFIHEEVQSEDKNSDEYRLLCRTVPFIPYEQIPQVCMEYLEKTDEELDAIAAETLNIYKQHFDMKKQFISEMEKINI